MAFCFLKSANIPLIKASGEGMRETSGNISTANSDFANIWAIFSSLRNFVFSCLFINECFILSLFFINDQVATVFYINQLKEMRKTIPLSKNAQYCKSEFYKLT